MVELLIDKELILVAVELISPENSYEKALELRRSLIQATSMIVINFIFKFIFIFGMF